MSGSESVGKSCLGQVHLMPFTKLVAANNWSCLRSDNRQNTDRLRGRRCHHTNRGGKVVEKAGWETFLLLTFIKHILKKRWETVSTRRRFSTLGPSWTGSSPVPDPKMSVSSTSWPTSRKGWEALKVNSYLFSSLLRVNWLRRSRVLLGQMGLQL